jgi:hypothetical protein
MNFAILNKARVTSKQSPQQLIELAKSATRLLRPPDLAETAFYLCASDPQAFYMLTFWYRLPSRDELMALNQFKPLQNMANNASLVTAQTFQLAWEYRRCDVTLNHSHLCLMTFPQDYPQPQVEVALEGHRKLIHNVPGMLGCWYGLALNTASAVMLRRMDWHDLEAQQAFFDRAKLAQMDLTCEQRGIALEYASFDLQAIVYPWETQKRSGDFKD